VRVNLPLLLASLAACAGLTALAAWILDWSFQRAAMLSPVIVLVAGAAAFLVVLWTRVAWESIRTHRRRGSVRH
jgi:ATP/ADP translocase